MSIILVLYQNIMKIQISIILALLIVNLIAQSITLGAKKCTLDGNCSKAKKFSGQNDINDFIKKYYPPPQYQCQTVCYPRGRLLVQSPLCRMVCPSTPPPMAKSAPVDPSLDFSKTNNHQSEVDQADILKTDGTYIYTISNQHLSIVHAYPALTASVISTINLNKYAKGLFIYKDILVVFGSQSSSSGVVTFVQIYDVSDRSSPTLKNEFSVLGDFYDGRMLQNGYIYLLSTSPIDTFTILPWYNTGNGQITCTQVYWYTQWSYQKPSFLNIFGFNMNNPRPSFIMSSFVIEGSLRTYYRSNRDAEKFNSNILYMSKQHIYFSQNTFANPDVTKISKIIVTPTFIRPIAFISLRGSANNQFAFSQYSNYLRVATTNLNGGQVSSNVYVLSYYLVIYGQINSIAPGEKIFSCRYVNKRLYLVTFKQVDPFFVIDLSSPSMPKILGQLKIPGYSTYLHPYDDNTIVGFGRDTIDVGSWADKQGLKIAIYNVTDTSNPVQTISRTLEPIQAYSNAQYQHKAFLLAPHKNLLVIPASYNNQNGPINGASVLFISPNSIIDEAFIDHLEGSQSLSDFSKYSVQRSLYIEDYVYTKSLCKIKIIERVNNFELPTLHLNC